MQGLCYYAVKSFCSPFKMNVRHMYHKPVELSRDWVPLISTETTEDHLLLLDTQETRSHHGLLSSKTIAARDLVKFLYKSHSHQVSDFSFMFSSHTYRRTSPKEKMMLPEWIREFAFKVIRRLHVFLVKKRNSSSTN